MTEQTLNRARANSKFASQVINRAAELLEQPPAPGEPEPSAINALYQARDEFRTRETREQRKLRTYGLPRLMPELRAYFRKHQGADPEGFGTITQWQERHGTAATARALREAALEIPGKVHQNTTAVARMESMTEKEMGEYVLMTQAARYLQEQGLQVVVGREWEQPDAPLDYRGTVNAVPWAFEPTRMWEPPSTIRQRKEGHPGERKNTMEQPEGLETPSSQTPHGPEVLQRTLDRTVEHGRKQCRMKNLDRAKYCLILHNLQFMRTRDWQTLTWPDLSDFDAVMILHDESIPPARVWQVMPPDAFGPTIATGAVADVERITTARLEQEPDLEKRRQLRQYLEELDISDEDLLQALREVREEANSRRE